MNVTFDPAKDAANIAKHGLAPLGDRLYYVVYVDRGSKRRIISLRKANGREAKHYAANN